LPKKHYSLAISTNAKISLGKLNPRVGGTIFERQSEFDSDESGFNEDEEIEDVVIDDGFTDPMKEVNLFVFI